ncbi:AraC family transcriptional regulator [Sporanaerobium hydrogeniformans]|uniref:AraC family transcriptional regulator n=1 Tax=Sporanaerobium hydrogeniformans TaxID=3072179 RepID=A0AC61DEG3_9FIRM|nr:DRTGG domain-containing protein [Sporanaerobium hydrogeniformans]PHV71032.1 AraC family transcriptional regulator [Sporanaerobium hydrogeniformans]
MTVEYIVNTLKVEVIAGKEGLSNEVSGGYTGDLLSFVMSHAKEKNIWLTIQGHINSVAVASLLGLSAIVLTEGVEADQEMLDKANEEGIPILKTLFNSFDFAVKLAQIEG